MRKIFWLSMALTACGGASPAPHSAANAPASVTATAAPLQGAAQRAPLDASALGTATGAKPEVSDKVVKVSFARDDVPVDVDGFSKMPPFMGLTSWAAFTPGEKPGVEAMVMGDLVVFEDEVNPVMSAALDHGLEVTALHNHFFFDKPRVFFMHIGGEGPADALAKGVRAALDAQKAVRAKSAQPTATFGAGALPAPSKIDPAKLDAVFGIKGTSKDGMYKAVMGRKATASCGCSVGKTMGVNTWAAFAGSDEAAVVDGDFAVTEGELQPVLKSLRSANVNIVAIHHHMTGESPRILFLHYWGRGSSEALGRAVKAALELTAWDR
ncbi:MAG: hypothetical protein JWM74_5898 [Myxococcaceae bacterium]|jgi:hypothetical protein|nr:hypothetical protein [Myxococcaceae bacterium]